MLNEFTISTKDVIDGLGKARLSVEITFFKGNRDSQDYANLVKSYEFAKSIAKQAYGGNELTPAQKRVAIRIIKKYLSEDLLKKLDLYEDSVVDIEKIRAEIKNVTEYLSLIHI